MDSLPMQMPLWTEIEDRAESVVNVAQIPQRSPFRYPGGKTWLVPHIRAWLKASPAPKLFVEPFVGGGIVSLTVAFEELAEHIIMSELDENVSALWKTILSDDSEWLVERILTFEMTAEAVREELSRTPECEREIGFQTLLRNRTCHGGIMAPGSGVMKHGENGRGIASRWYPKTLATRIQRIAAIRNRITFHHADGLAFMREHARERNASFFIDPPYTAGKNGKRAGRRLYACNEVDHESLFAISKTLAGRFLMTYDDADEIVEMAERSGFVSTTVSMKNTHHAQMQELLIGRDLSWLR